MIQLEIVTPERKVYSDTVDSVVVPTTTGEIGILPGHIPLLTMLQAGEIAVSKGGRQEYLAVGKGFAECVGDKVSILAERAIVGADIDESAVLDAELRAEEALKGAKEMTPEEIDRLESTVQYARAQMLVRKRR